LIPVLVGNTEAPPFLRDRQAIRVAQESDWDAAAQSLLAALQSGSTGNVVPQTSSEAMQAVKQQRLSQIAEEAAKLTPNEAEREARIEALTAKLAEARQRRAGEAEVADWEIKLADALKLAKRNAEAVAHLQAAVPLLSASPESRRQLARAHLNLGRHLEELGKTNDALAHWKDALALYEQLDGSNALMVASANASLAALYSKLGDLAAADKHRKALRAGLSGLLANLPIVGRFFETFFGLKEDKSGGTASTKAKTRDHKDAGKTNSGGEA
jgi:tetratricopeptide (TPR) repeat protein